MTTAPVATERAAIRTRSTPASSMRKRDDGRASLTVAVCGSSQVFETEVDKNVAPAPLNRQNVRAYSSICMITGATAATDRPFSKRITRTPCVARPALRTWTAGTRITTPSLAMTRMS